MKIDKKIRLLCETLFTQINMNQAHQILKDDDGEIKARFDIGDIVVYEEINDLDGRVYSYIRSVLSTRKESFEFMVEDIIDTFDISDEAYDFINWKKVFKTTILRVVEIVEG